MKPATAVSTLALLGAVSAPLVANARLVLEDAGFRATVSEPVRCGVPLELAVTTRDPALLDADTADIQRVVDASVAALRFQCPDIPELRVRGSLADGAQDRFVAVAGRNSAWRVQPTETFRLDVSSARARDRGAGGTSTQTGRVVAGLEPGMSIEAARAALTSRFGTSPRLVDGERLVVELNDCRAGTDWRNPPAGMRPGWRCLQAWFTRGEDPQLYRVDYAEVVEGNRLEEATDMLVSRYGEPRSRERRSWWQDQPRAMHLYWGDEVVMNGAPRHELQAAVRPSTRMTVLELSLYDPALTHTAEGEFQF